ncbi:hypothetical protein L1049_024786 [Liquidambar formosana]|uniref:Uncharacterized protein n=1 Tax=Liquidambar formosana TaxID=63359 RepID=A0AAP0RVP0_LIQFO
MWSNSSLLVFTFWRGFHGSVKLDDPLANYELHLSYIIASRLGVPQQVIAVNGKFPGPPWNINAAFGKNGPTDRSKWEYYKSCRLFVGSLIPSCARKTSLSRCLHKGLGDPRCLDYIPAPLSYNRRGRLEKTWSRLLQINWNFCILDASVSLLIYFKFVMTFWKVQV